MPPVFSRALRLLSLALLALLVAVPVAQGQRRVVQTLYPLPSLIEGHGSFADIDGDGDQDMLLTGNRAGSAFTKFYVYADTSVRPSSPGPRIEFKYYRTSPLNVRAVRQGDSAWGDLNGDGRPDLILTGLAGNPVTDVYFNETSAQDQVSLRGIPTDNIPGVYEGAVAMAPPSAPGGVVPFVLICGATRTGDDPQPFTGLYANDGSGSLSPVLFRGPALSQCDAAWSDFDGDGDADLALVGNSGGSFRTELFRNDGGAFTPYQVGEFTETAFGSVSWGDYDGDGDPDLLTSGGVLDPLILRGVTQLYRNDGGTLTPVDTNLPGVVGGEARFLNFDGNGFADIVLMGERRVLGDADFGIYQGDGRGGFVPDLVPGELSNQDTGLPEVKGFYRGGFAIGDYNSDGDDDVVVLGVIREVLVANSGGGTDPVFDQPRTYFIKSIRVFGEKGPGDYDEWQTPGGGGGGGN